MRVISIALLAMLLLSGPVAAETSFEEALTDYEVTMALMAVAWEKAEADSYDDVSVQMIEDETRAGLDKIGSFVVSSCYDGWHMTVMTYLRMQVSALMNNRLGNHDVADVMVGSLSGLRALETQTRLEATIACEIGD